MAVRLQTLPDRGWGWWKKKHLPIQFRIRSGKSRILRTNFWGGFLKAGNKIKKRFPVGIINHLFKHHVWRRLKDKESSGSLRSTNHPNNTTPFKSLILKKMVWKRARMETPSSYHGQLYVSSIHVAWWLTV